MKRQISTLDGIFVLSESGFYEPIEDHYRYRGPILVAACLIGWAAFIGAGYAIWQALAALGIA